MENAEIVSINPLIPQSWGTFEARGAPPDPQQEVSCASFSAVSAMNHAKYRRDRNE
jgi:hypothetical protein